MSAVNELPFFVVQGVEEPGVDEFLDQPDRRQVATFFLGALFLYSLHCVYDCPLVRYWLRSLGSWLESGFSAKQKVDVPAEMTRTSDPTTTSLKSITQEYELVKLALSVSFALSAFSFFSSLLSFSITEGDTLCAFEVAWGGVAGDTARLLGVMVLSLYLRRLGISRLELFALWVGVLAGLATIVAKNVIAIGITRSIPEMGFSLCYKEHFLPTSLVSSSLHLLLEVYILIRLYMLMAPPFFHPRHQIGVLVDERVLAAYSLIIFDLLTVIPSALFTSVTGDYVPFSIGALIILMTFHHASFALDDPDAYSIPAASSAESEKATWSRRQAGHGSRPRDDDQPSDNNLRPPRIGSRVMSSVSSLSRYSTASADVEKQRAVDGLGPSPPQRFDVSQSLRDAAMEEEREAGVQPSRRGRIMSSQAEYFDSLMLDSAERALAPRRPPDLQLQPVPSERNERHDSRHTIANSRVSSVVYGSDIVREHSGRDATKVHGRPDSMVSASVESGDPRSGELRDDIDRTPRSSVRRSQASSWGVAAVRASSDSRYTSTYRWSTVRDQTAALRDESRPPRHREHLVKPSEKEELRTPVSVRFSGAPSPHSSPPDVPELPLPRLQLSPSSPSGVADLSPLSPRQGIGPAGMLRGPRPPPVSYYTAGRGLVYPDIRGNRG